MKKALKRLLVLVLVFCISTVAFADSSADLYDIFSLDEIIGDKNALKNSGAMEAIRGTGYSESAESLIQKYANAYNFSLTFGNYPQSGISEMTKEPIEWIILEKNAGKALLISKDVLFIGPLVFGDTAEERKLKASNYSWSTCDMRNYLNNEFFNTAFSSVEKSRIIPYDATGDNVFILSKAEATSYFNLNDQNFKWDIWFNGLDTNWYHHGNPWFFSKLTNFAQNGSVTMLLKKKGAGESTNRSRCFFRDSDSIGFSPDSSVGKIFHPSPISHARDINGIRPCVWIKYDPYVKSAKTQTRENTYNKIGENIADAALDYLIPGIGIFIP